MSIRVMSYVWERSKLGGTELLCLLAIADFADDDGVAFPSVATIAGKIRMSERNTHYLISKIVDAGELMVERNAGPRGCNLFRVQTLQGVQPVAGGGATGSAKGVQPIAPEPSLNHQGTVKDIRGKKAKSQKRPIPVDWEPKQATVEIISREFGLRVPEDVCKYVAAFRDTCEAKGYQYADFDAAFRNCVRQDWPKFRSVQAKGSGAGSISDGQSWWATNAGIDKKGRELGLSPRSTESYPEYKDRIFAKLRQERATA